MCVTCGCSDDSQTTMTDLQTGTVTAIAAPNAHAGEHTHVLEDGTVVTHANHHNHLDEHHHEHNHHEHSHHEHNHQSHHEHPHDHAHTHTHEVAQIHARMHGNTIELEHKILAKNDLIAAQNRGWLKGRNILALNLVSSPGSGKTTLLTRTITDVKGVRSH